MLIAFEGQDGAGKTALLTAVHRALLQLGFDVIAVPEFSGSPYGQCLVDAVARDKFLRPTRGEPATVLTRVFETVADLYYLDERVIGPALDRGQVVLKDRHRDTILYTLTPTLVDGGVAPSEDHALVWLRALISRIRYQPDLTVYVEAPLPVRLDRIAGRTSDVREHRAHEVSEDDLAVFAARDRVLQKLQAEPSGGHLVVSNGDRSIEEGTAEVVAVVRRHLASNRAGTSPRAR